MPFLILLMKDGIVFNKAMKMIRMFLTCSTYNKIVEIIQFNLFSVCHKTIFSTYLNNFSRQIFMYL